MRVAVLSRSRSLYTTRRLLQACRAEGATAQVYDPLELFLMVGDGPPKLFHRESARPVDRLDVAFPRIGTALTEYGLVVIRQLEVMGVPVVNRAAAISMSRDKMGCLQQLSSHGIDTPRTAVIRDPRQLPLALDQVGGPPVVLKRIQGSQGIGVVLLETVDAIESVLDMMWSLGQVMLIQEFVRESRGRDLRALVVGGEVLIAMRRHARAGEFRSNIHRGGTGTVVQLDETCQRAAVESARVVGLDVAGVDMLEAHGGPKVMEVNSSPGFEGLEAATGIDVAAAIIRHGIRLSRAATGSSGTDRVLAVGTPTPGKAEH